MRARHILLGCALAGSLALLAHGDDEPAAGQAALLAGPVALPARAADDTPQQAPWVMRVLPRGTGDDAGDDGASAFRSRTWNPPLPGEEEAQHLEPPPPSAPPLPFRYIGKALGVQGWEVYLAEGEAVHVARTDDVIGAYRVTEIRPPSMRLRYLPLDEEQGIDIGAGE